jgi:hypothetical protein
MSAARAVGKAAIRATGWVGILVTGQHPSYIRELRLPIQADITPTTGMGSVDTRAVAVVDLTVLRTVWADIRDMDRVAIPVVGYLVAGAVEDMVVCNPDTEVAEYRPTDLEPLYNAVIIESRVTPAACHSPQFLQRPVATPSPMHVQLLAVAVM